MPAVRSSDPVLGLLGSPAAATAARALTGAPPALPAVLAAPCPDVLDGDRLPSHV